ncbi:TonB-dependent receptor [Kordiimonas sp. SCSIO 12610]|uniref:TonB-dependent receptor n=1 Tax=Kordiimonas sp. SCSIO 12610 TaxID=2829597 RepID=UPI00210C484A|nr:TonB-dependent receptor [Kordiimonas sp. SCSIO 12610]UTW54830.1 TonB-dependent receptor [Kordiimonas sp. SCSIO 12610]
MKSQTKAALWGSVALAALAVNTPVIAQQITSTIQGTVFAPDGSVVAGAAVTITDTRTGASTSVTTNNNGLFSARGLAVGGPYTVRVSSSQYQGQVITGISLSLSGGADIDVNLQSANSDIEEITVTASASIVTNVAIGPSSSFNLTDIETLPSVSRQIRDVIRLDPRVNIARSGGGQGFQANCLGGNSRGNAFTIDGVRSGDAFGLNASGNSARNTFPIPFDTIAAAAVEFSPVDVQYGQFTGCAINVTTKSGSNEFHGSAFFLYTGDGLTGSTIDDPAVPGPIEADFDNYNWGAELGGPIIEDKLFFYGSYEETDAGGIQDEGIGAGFANQITSISLDEANRAAAAIQNIFGRDVGEQVTTLPATSRRFFGRVDWNVADGHRLEATYTRLEELSTFGDAIGGGRGEFTFSDNFQNVGSNSNAYRVALFSDWTDNFSTEIRASRIEVEDIQNPIGGGEQQSDNPIPRVAIGLPFANEFFGQDFASGPGIFRSANQLDTTVDQIKIAGTYNSGNHQITAGYELDSLDVFNLFVINATGTLFFNSVDDLEAGNIRAIRQNGSFSGDINDAAAAFTRNIHSLYIQDEWQVTDSLQVVAGLRYDFYTSDDAPNLNPVFQERYGFANNQGLDGFEIFQPRLGVTWELPDNFGETTLTAGWGRFAGGDPTVWFSNAFQNFGGTIGLGDAGDSFGSNDVCTDADLASTIVNGQFQGLPACLAAEQQLRTGAFDSDVAATDPNFTPPSVDRFNIGLTHYTQDTGIDFFNDWNIQIDAIYSRNRNAVDFIDLSIAQNGTAPDGRPIFANIDPLLAGCNATLSSDLRSYNNLSPECFAGADVGQNILLTNAVNGGGDALSISAQFGKEFLLSDTGTLDVRLGYAFSDANVGNAGNSSTAGSNFEEVTTSNFNNVPVADSFFNNRHNFVLAATYRNEFWEDLATTAGVFFRVNTGRPLSFVFDNDTSADTFGDSDDEARSLLYIPTGPNDPLVQFADGFDVDGFFQFLADNDLTQFAGGIAPRGAITQQTNADIDLRFTQEVPTPFDGHKIELSLNFENFLNFIDSGAGVQRFINTSNTAEGVDVLGATINDQGQFVFDDFNANAVDVDVDSLDTLWRIQVGVKYKF